MENKEPNSYAPTRIYFKNALFPVQTENVAND